MSLQLSAELAAEYRNFWRPNDAERVIDRMFELHPHHPLAYTAAIANLGYHGRFADAVLMLEQALEAHPENEGFQHWHGHALLLLGLLEEAEDVGDKDVLVQSAMLRGDMEQARERLEAGLATGEDLGKWLSAGRLLNQVDRSEGSVAQLRALVERSLENWDSRNYDWSSDCWPELIYQMKEAGFDAETEPMMSECERSLEERFEARYLCPCMMYGVVQYTILSGRLEEAVERADFWLENGDSYYLLHLDPIFSQLSSHPRYADLLARNASHQARQRELYLANRDEADPDSWRNEVTGGP
jgi:tetratricopeptide (TPR) repeat protein